ncbi:fasciclin-like arabinogalactan protein 9 [Dioscorea cayenensis subsp. rotundata]|uniref:Fasciclin-like arabinogalactan protein 9 n=1 Tax=Dioscorea cayennensis subsp. rotundata TaxID=55577 RepID=A0AB40CXP1_DIOCR|nr:fasciclin-like arabinogalactan protein 9 [Dioscorea cayenensis subsp. rotundata]
MAYLTIILGALLILSTPNLLIHAKTTPIAPGPTPAPLNLTGVLEKGGQYTTFLRLLKETQVGQQVQSQLNNSYDGLTIFAPTDNAFSNLKAGTLNSLNAQEQVSLILYHVLPRYYSLVTFETASNPVRTQASGSNGVYAVNITSSTNQVNVSTGIVNTPVQTVLYSDFPLAVYSVDKVLLPYDLFGPKPPASAPEPADHSPKKPTKKSPAADAPSEEAVASPSTASPSERTTGWRTLVVVMGFLVFFCMGGHL